MSSSEKSERPLFETTYLVMVEDDPGSLTGEPLWITGLDHFVQTRKAKHSAILQAVHTHWLHSRATQLNDIRRNIFDREGRDSAYPKLMNKSHQPRAATSPDMNII